MGVVRSLAILFSPRERRQVVWLLLAMVIMALAEVAGIVSIMPFLALLADPEVFRDNPLLNRLYTALRFSSTGSFLIFLGLLVLGVLTFSNAFAALTMRTLYRFTWRQNHKLSLRLLKTYLHKPYVFFLEHNTAHLGKNLLLEVQEVVSGVLVPAMQLAARGLVSLFILTLLVAVNPALAATVALVLGGAYAGLYTLLRRRLNRLGKERVAANANRFRIAGEALSSVKDVRVLHREAAFIDEYAVHSLRYSDHTATKRIITELPRYAFEVLAFGGILLIILYLLGAQRNVSQLLPLIGLYAFASYRLLPALQQVFGASAEIRANLASFEVLRKDLQANEESLDNHGTDQTLTFARELSLSHATFKYPGAQQAVFRNFSLEIRPRTSVAFVGATGSGKTTIVDVLLGLLSLDEGMLTVDSVELHRGNLTSWQKLLGYVPQKIYLSDDTIARNIAFGIPKAQIDLGAVERAARLANIHDFIAGELPDKYETVVGDRGVRLSGGQQQRLGIARALYHDPAVLILDEATSALDSVTEAGILADIKGITPRKTLVMIAHRLSTVRDCDEIFLLGRGKLLARGSYQELAANNAQFREMAQVALEETR